MKKRLLIVVCFLIIPMVFALTNPAITYCKKLGYEYIFGPNGEFCVIDENTKFDMYEFFDGDVGNEYNYCTKQNYDYKIDKSKGFSQILCIVNDTDKSLWDLMDLKEGELIKNIPICGNSYCEGVENHESCPNDCEQSSADGLCEKIDDNICDSDCYVKEDIDCQPKISNKIKNFRYNNSKIFYSGIGIILVLLISILILKWKKNLQK